MRRLVIIVFLVVVILLLSAFSSCVATSGDISASLGQEFTLPLGQKVFIESENLLIKFDEVTEDSRCPRGTECVWAGEAGCGLFIEYCGSPAEMVLIQPGGDVSATDYFIMYKIVFKLEPYPEEGKQIIDSDYKLIMTVTKPE
jgi:hypothetical protein